MTPKRTNFASIRDRSKKVDDFDSGLHNFLADCTVEKLGGFGTDGFKLFGADGAPFVNRVTYQIE